MRLLDMLLMRFRSLFQRKSESQSLDAETAVSLDRQIAENIAGGMSAEEARQAALRVFGKSARVARAGSRHMELELAGIARSRYPIRSAHAAPYTGFYVRGCFSDSAWHRGERRTVRGGARGCCSSRCRSKTPTAHDGVRAWNWRRYSEQPVQHSFRRDVCGMEKTEPQF